MPDYKQPIVNQWGGNILYPSDYVSLNNDGRKAGTATNDVPATGGKTTDWLNASGATNDTHSSNAYCSVTTSPWVFPYLRLSNYGFAIPASATILGIEVRVAIGGTHNTTEIYDDEIRLAWNASAANLSTDNKATGTPKAVYEYYTVGGPADLWGELSSTLTPAVINSSDFGVVIKAGRATGSAQRFFGVASVRITVYYSDSADGNVRLSQSYVEVLSTVGNAAVATPQPGSTRMVVVT